MSETYQLVSGVNPEASLYDGITFYEEGEVYQAIQCWKRLLEQVPDHELAQHYIKFVLGYLGLNDGASEREVRAAHRRESDRLRGGSEAVSILQPASGYAEEPTTQNAQVPETLDASSQEALLSSRSTIPETQIGGIAPQAQDSESQASLLSPQERREQQLEQAARATAPSSAEVLTPSSEVAQHAISGPQGPRTQADGLTIQSLSRQLATLHRSGKYEEAVEIAKQLLVQDPQHQVARRYIDEYHRQKQVALRQRQRTQSQTQPQDAVSSSSSSVPNKEPDKEPLRSREVPTVTPSSRAEELSEEDAIVPTSIAPPHRELLKELDDSPDSSEVPTAAPLQAAPPAPDPMSAISDFEAKPEVKTSPDQISWQNFDHRAGFFISQVDGKTSYEELIMISGMPREQALKILGELVLSGMIG